MNHELLLRVFAPPLLALCLANCGSDVSERASGAAQLSGDAGRGEALYIDCGVCHGASGEGTQLGPNIRGEVGDFTDAEIIQVMLDGPDEMPSYAAKSDQDLTDIVAYLRTW